MTSKLTRERLEKIKSWRETYGAGSNVMLPAEEAEELARIALAAMDSEPVAYMTYKGYLLHAGDPKLAEYSAPMPLYADPRPTTIPAEPVAWLLSGGGAKNVVCFDSGNAYADPLREVTPLYRHAQPVQPSVDDDVRNIIGLLEANEWAEHCTSTVLGSRLEAEITRLIGRAQPAPVVPDFQDVLESLDYEVRCNAWESEHVMQACQATYDACRAAMLQKLQKSAGAEATCRSNENVQVLHTKSPAQSDCCPAQNHVSPEQNGDTPAQSQGWIPLSEQMPPPRYEVLVGRWWGEKPRWCCKWATYIPGHPDSQSSGWLIPGASWTPTHWMPLPAAPQEVK
ncbi:TPA: DUF551 domain-containing protein [Klebsiella pneumoniae]|nr:DUF551 domain-containing protein [Klebsiella pneumoniae]